MSFSTVSLFSHIRMRGGCANERLCAEEPCLHLRRYPRPGISCWLVVLGLTGLGDSISVYIRLSP